MTSPLPDSDSTVSVVIPTTLSKLRWPLLQRLLKGLANEGADEVLVVVNGPDVDPDALIALEEWPAVRIIRLGSVGLRQSRYEGTAAARGTFIQFADDDDELFPGAISSRRELLRDLPSARLVVSRGYLTRAGVTREFPSYRLTEVSDPQFSLLVENWNGTAVCAMYRRSEELKDLMFNAPGSMEWTVIGFDLARSIEHVGVLDDLQYHIHDTPGSLSKQLEYMVGESDSLSRMLEIPMSNQSKSLLLRKLASSRHDCARAFLSEHRYYEAWSWHLRSLRSRGGMRFLKFTIRLLLALPRSLQKKRSVEPG